MSHRDAFGVTLGSNVSGPVASSYTIVATTNYTNQLIQTFTVGPCVIQAIGAAAEANAGLSKTATISLWVDGVKLWNFGSIPSTATALMACFDGTGRLWADHASTTGPITLLPMQIRAEVKFEWKLNVTNNSDGSSRLIYAYASYLRE